MRKTFGMCAVAALLFALAGVVASASGTGFASGEASDHRGHLQVLHVRTVDVAERFIDLGDPDFSQGDRNVFTADLYEGDRRVGFDGGFCTVVRIHPDGSSTLQCLGTNSLPYGQLTVQGFVNVSAEGELQPFELAITGGTGGYRTARGQVDGRPVGETGLDLVFRIFR
jgi:hypothetical protein